MWQIPINPHQVPAAIQVIRHPDLILQDTLEIQIPENSMYPAATV
jgi:hypothetical protein